MRSYWWATAAQDSRGEPARRLPYGGMARRRADGEPGLIDRVRWRNVGGLAALLAAGLAIALGPRSCGEPAPARLPEEEPVAPPAGREVAPAPAAPARARDGGGGKREEGGRSRRPRRRRSHRERPPVAPAKPV